ncbi:hypothetical protein [Elongatibacter sediminis]|uniref:Uncharacterized protein n=1 Tax=Elongatibacter sediminis TaxID=3119006 RepID=A0AAW9RCA3_9GAMM
MAVGRRAREGEIHVSGLFLTSVRYGLVYFLLVFGAGFALAPVRELVLAPAIGPLWAELFEMPVMAAFIWLAAGWVVRRPGMAGRAAMCLVAGLLALALMVLAELSVVWLVRGMTLAEYAASREPVTGVIYLAMLLVFALLPWLRSGPGRG